MPRSPGSAPARRRCGTRTRSSPGCATCCATRAPDVLDALFAAGATRDPVHRAPAETLTDRRPRPGDDELVALACRRTTFEWVLRRLVLDEPGVELRHGVAAAALDASRRPGTDPAVSSASTVCAADLVVDARGPRSSSADWLAAIGVGEPVRRGAARERHRLLLAVLPRARRAPSRRRTPVRPRPISATSSTRSSSATTAPSRSPTRSRVTTSSCAARSPRPRRSRPSARALVAPRPWRGRRGRRRRSPTCT